MTTLIISNNDLNDLIKIVTSLEEHDILLKGSLFGNLLTGKGLHRTGKGKYRTGPGFKKNINFITSSNKFRNNGLF